MTSSPARRVHIWLYSTRQQTLAIGFSSCWPDTEILRQQTQARLDEAFIGRDLSTAIPRKGTKATKKHVGVGLIRTDLAQASGMTTVLQDFNGRSYQATNITVQTNAAHPYVFVVKKNRHVLAALKKWLEEQVGRFKRQALRASDDAGRRVRLRFH